MVRCILIMGWVLGWCLVFNFGQIFAKEIPWLEIISPEEGARLISRRPEIRLRVLRPFQADTLFVMLDNTDITPLVSLRENEIYYRPFQVLPPGEHVLLISITDLEGQTWQKEIHFYTRHTRLLEEAVIQNELSAYYQTTLKKPDSPPDQPDSKVEANLSAEGRIAASPFKASLRTNLRFVDQNTPLSPPQEKGLEMVNWLFTGVYEGEHLRFQGDIGDVQITETPYTIASLARRGGYFRFEGGGYALRLFSVKSAQVFGLEGGTGISTETKEHILGIAGEAHWFEEKLVFKAVYAEGEEPGSSFGIYSSPGTTEGEVFGLVVSSRLSEKFSAEAEVDFSRYDPDTSDEFGKESDNAYHLKFSGTAGRYHYEFLYEYFGRDYAVVGQSVERDKAGFSFTGGGSWGAHNLGLQFSRYHDNVEKDDLFPRIYSSQFGINYSCNYFSRVPLNFSYQKSIQDSRYEPQYTFPLKLHTDTFSAQVTFLMGKWNLGLAGSFSFMNDRTSENRDTSNLMFSFAPSYTGERFSLSPSFSYNESRDLTSGVKTRTYTLTLDFRTDFWSGKGNFNLSGTYNLVNSSDDSVDNRSLNFNFNLTYNFSYLFQGSLRPAFQLRGNYTKTIDRVYSCSDEEYGIYLVFTLFWTFSL